MSAVTPVAEPTIRTRHVPSCPACGTRGSTLYEGLVDALYGAPGQWRMVRCTDTSCRMLWLDPAPIEDDLGIAYREYHTHERAPRRSALSRTIRRWVKQGHYARRFGYRVSGSFAKRFLASALASDRALAESLDRLIYFLPPRSRGRMLDVGCGEGASLAELRDLGWEVEGVDFDAGAIAAATARGLNVRAGSLEDQRFPDASFDAVTLGHVVEHVIDPIALLRECARVLRPGGRVVAITPNAECLGHERFGRAWRGLEPPRHLQVFTGDALRRIATLAGLEIQSLTSIATAARFMYVASAQIAGADAEGAAAAAFEQEERNALPFRPWAGEELLLIATRR